MPGSEIADLVQADLWNYSSIEKELSGFDACFLLPGRLGGGMKEADYERVTYGIAVAAETLARVKGKTENAILRWAFPARILTTEQIGRPMLKVARSDAPKRIFESPDINLL